jgi:hypothetical protein
VFYGAMLLFLTNLTGIILAAGLSFMVIGYAPFSRAILSRALAKAPATPESTATSKSRVEECKRPALKVMFPTTLRFGHRLAEFRGVLWCHAVISNQPDWDYSGCGLILEGALSAL